MRTPRLIWNAVNSWMLWRARRKLRKAVPALVALDISRQEIARQHRPGARAIDAERKRLVTERLQIELGWNVDG